MGFRLCPAVSCESGRCAQRVEGLGGPGKEESPGRALGHVSAASLQTGPPRAVRQCQPVPGKCLETWLLVWEACSPASHRRCQCQVHITVWMCVVSGTRLSKAQSHTRVCLSTVSDFMRIKPWIWSYGRGFPRALTEAVARGQSPVVEGEPFHTGGSHGFASDRVRPGQQGLRKEG